MIDGHPVLIDDASGLPVTRGIDDHGVAWHQPPTAPGSVTAPMPSVPAPPVATPPAVATGSAARTPFDGTGRDFRIGSQYLLPADLRGAGLSSANLAGLSLFRTDLSGANLSYAGLGGSILREVNLQGANLHDADLTFADLSGANLSGADLSGADLTNADLTGCNWSGAILSRTDFGDRVVRDQVRALARQSPPPVAAPPATAPVAPATVTAPTVTAPSGLASEVAGYREYFPGRINALTVASADPTIQSPMAEVMGDYFGGTIGSQFTLPSGPVTPSRSLLRVDDPLTGLSTTAYAMAAGGSQAECPFEVQVVAPDGTALSTLMSPTPMSPTRIQNMVKQVANWARRIVLRSRAAMAPTAAPAEPQSAPAVATGQASASASASTAVSPQVAGDEGKYVDPGETPGGWEWEPGAARIRQENPASDAQRARDRQQIEEEAARLMTDFAGAGGEMTGPPERRRPLADHLVRQLGATAGNARPARPGEASPVTAEWTATTGSDQSPGSGTWRLTTGPTEGMRARTYTFALGNTQANRRWLAAFAATMRINQQRLPTVSGHFLPLPKAPGSVGVGVESFADQVESLVTGLPVPGQLDPGIGRARVATIVPSAYHWARNARNEPILIHTADNREVDQNYPQFAPAVVALGAPEGARRASPDELPDRPSDPMTLDRYYRQSFAGQDLRLRMQVGGDLHGKDMSETDLSGCDLSGVDLGLLTNQVDTRAGPAGYPPIPLRSLNGANLAGANLRNTRGANLNWQQRHSISAVGANFDGADLTGSTIGKRGDLRNTSFKGARLHDFDVESAELANADLRGVISETAPGSSSAAGRFWETLGLRGSDTKLDGANLSGLDLRQVVLEIPVSNANFSQTKLSGRRLHHAMKNCDFWNADLRDCTFEREVSGSAFSLADLRGAVFHQAADIGPDGWRDALVDDRTLIQRANPWLVPLEGSSPVSPQTGANRAHAMGSLVQMNADWDRSATEGGTRPAEWLSETTQDAYRWNRPGYLPWPGAQAAHDRATGRSSGPSADYMGVIGSCRTTTPDSQVGDWVRYAQAGASGSVVLTNPVRVTFMAGDQVSGPSYTLQSLDFLPDERRAWLRGTGGANSLLGHIVGPETPVQDDAVTFQAPDSAQGRAWIGVIAGAMAVNAQRRDSNRNPSAVTLAYIPLPLAPSVDLSGETAVSARLIAFRQLSSLLAGQDGAIGAEGFASGPGPRTPVVPLSLSPRDADANIQAVTRQLADDGIWAGSRARHHELGASIDLAGDQHGPGGTVAPVHLRTLTSSQNIALRLVDTSPDDQRAPNLPVYNSDHDPWQEIRFSLPENPATRAWLSVISAVMRVNRARACFRYHGTNGAGAGGLGAIPIPLAPPPGPMTAANAQQRALDQIRSLMTGQAVLAAPRVQRAARAPAPAGVPGPATNALGQPIARPRPAGLLRDVRFSPSHAISFPAMGSGRPPADVRKPSPVAGPFDPRNPSAVSVDPQPAVPNGVPLPGNRRFNPAQPIKQFVTAGDYAAGLGAQPGGVASARTGVSPLSLAPLNLGDMGPPATRITTPGVAEAYLRTLYPGLAAYDTQNGPHNGNSVIDHTLLGIRNIAEAGLSTPQKKLLRLAWLFHDAGKLANGRDPNHQDLSVPVAIDALATYGLSDSDMQTVQMLIGTIMRSAT